MLAVLRFLVKLAALAAVGAFISSIGMAWLFAHPEVKTSTVKKWVHDATHNHN